MAASLLEIDGLEQYYGESHTLWDLSLSVGDGACTCLMGRNGVGKSTLLRCIMGVLPVAGGHIRFDGKDITSLRPEQRARLGIGYVPQGREVFSQLTVRENLEVGLAARRDGSREIPGEVFQLFPVLREMLQRQGGNLSGGQQQQLASARALGAEPRLLILDEPTEGIQPNIVQQIGEVVTELNQSRGLTVLLVEQKLPFARRVAEHFSILDRGRRVAEGAIQALDENLVDTYLKV